MSNYNTKQRRVLADYLSRHADEKLTAKEIAAELAKQNISLSAVYRNLCALEEAGKVSRVSAAGCREVLYRYTGVEGCKGHLHLSCKKCGRTFHMDEESTEELISKVAGCQFFAVDRVETVLYGTCRDCACCGCGAEDCRE